jgi:hypothetical protein
MHLSRFYALLAAALGGLILIGTPAAAEDTSRGD